MPAAPTTRLTLAGDTLEEARHADSTARAKRYNSLTAKMAAYQQGIGPAPAIREFEQWKEDAAFQQAMRRLLANAPLAS